MRTALLFSLLAAVPALAQTPAKPATPPATTAAPTPQTPAAGTPAPAKPATPTPARRPAAPTGRAGMAITVTTMTGTTIPGVHIEANGPMMRMGDTDAGGQLTLPGLQAGTYRLRFS